MARYIDADAFKQKLADKDIFFPALYANELNEMPAADVVPKSEVAREIITDLAEQGLLNVESWAIEELKKKYTENAE